MEIKWFALKAHAVKQHLISTVHPQSRLVCERCTSTAAKYAKETEDKFEPRLQLDQVPTQLLLRMVFDLRLIKGDTNCAECGSKYLPYERNARAQQNDNAFTLLKDLFKEVLPQLSEAAREKLKIPNSGPSQALEPSTPTFLALQQKLHQMNLKIEKQAHQVTQARLKADNEFEKLIALKQEYLKLKQELAVPYVTNTAEPWCSRSRKRWRTRPQKPSSANSCTGTVRPSKPHMLAHNIAENPTLLVRERHPKASLDDETDRTRQSSRPGLEATAEGPIYW